MEEALCLQNERGKPARGVCTKEIQWAVPKLIQKCLKGGQLKGKLHISADHARCHRVLDTWLPQPGHDRAPTGVGHDFQLPIERSFARGKAAAAKKINEETGPITADKLFRFFKEAWEAANPVQVLQKEISNMRLVWERIVQTGGGYCTGQMLTQALKEQKAKGL